MGVQDEIVAPSKLKVAAVVAFYMVSALVVRGSES